MNKTSAHFVAALLGALLFAKASHINGETIEDQLDGK